jgi:excisionase family DNA binding protein
MTEELIKPSVAAKRLGIARSTIYKWIDERRIGSVEIPGKPGERPTVRIPRAELEKFERQFTRRPAGGDDVKSEGIRTPGLVAALA